MTKHIDLDALQALPTASIGADQHLDGSFSVTLTVSGLTSQEQANAAIEHMQRLLCGEEIKERQ